MTVANLLTWCQQHVGIRETGTNDVVFWTWYREIYGPNYQGSAWCGCAVDVAMTRGGGWKPPSYFISVAEIEQWGRQNGRYHSGTAGVRPGDILILFGYGVHTGICRAVPSYGTIKTYEGNTSSGLVGSQYNGDGFYARIRSTSNIRGYVRVSDILDHHLQPKPVYGFRLAPLPLRVDGAFGPQTIGYTQKACGAGVDGVFGTETKRKLQAHLRVRTDGDIGPITIKALQKRVGYRQTGVWDSGTTEALQKKLNVRGF